MLPRPRFRMPIWMAAAAVLGAYVIRSAMRGWDMRPDMPMDAVVLGLAVVVFGAVAWLRHDDERRDASDDTSSHAEHDTETPGR